MLVAECGLKCKNDGLSFLHLTNNVQDILFT